jgi:hypothetical protein
VQARAISGAAIPALDPDARYLGHDTSGQVRVEIDGAARRVAVGLGREWRRTVGAEALGAAILAAFTAATTERLTAWAEQPARPAPAPVLIERPPPTPEIFRLLSRASRDLLEYRLRLTELHSAAATRAAPGRTVVVTVRAGRIGRIDLDPEWLRSAGDADVERVTGHTLSAALDDLARLPEHVLEHCPDLRAVLATHQESDR